MLLKRKRQARECRRYLIRVASQHLRLEPRVCAFEQSVKIGQQAMTDFQSDAPVILVETRPDRPSRPPRNQRAGDKETRGVPAKHIPALPTDACPACAPIRPGASRGIVGRRGLRVSCPEPLRARSITARPTGRDNGDRTIHDRIGNIRCDSAKVPTSHRPNRQASALAGRPSEADPQIPVRGVGQRDVIAIRHHRHRPTSARSRRLRTPPGSAHPSGAKLRNPAGQAWTGLSAHHFKSNGQSRRTGGGKRRSGRHFQRAFASDPPVWQANFTTTDGLRALSDRPRPSCRARSSARTKPSALRSASSFRLP